VHPREKILSSQLDGGVESRREESRFFSGGDTQQVRSNLSCCPKVDNRVEEKILIFSSTYRCSFTPLSRQESFRFCPRVFGINHHFPQESALRRAQIHALLWAYRGPRAMDAGARVNLRWYMSVHAYMQAYASSSSSTSSIHVLSHIRRYSKMHPSVFQRLMNHLLQTFERSTIDGWP
jgi:hypothetical protein